MYDGSLSLSLSLYAHTVDIRKISMFLYVNVKDGEKVFECGYEQLQDLVARLKVARNSAIRVLRQ